MTVKQILEAVEPAKPMTRATLYTHLDALRIKPVGARQKPQQYPADTPGRILRRLGLTAANHNRRKAA